MITSTQFPNWLLPNIILRWLLSKKVKTFYWDEKLKTLYSYSRLAFND